jgi:flavin reductase (DIM6/NTAB) family NADH-FMN oxidoreductase RutF
MAHSIPPSQSAPAAARDPASGQTGGADPIGAALGRIPSGLFVVTWREGDRDHGMLASWVMQAGFAPPAVSVAIAPGRDLLAAIDRGATFAINVLGEGQRPLLSRFGRPATAGEDPFDGLEHSRTPAGDLILQGSAAWLACGPLGRLEVTDHVIMLARIDAAGPGSVADPLVHVRKNGLRY